MLFKTCTDFYIESLLLKQKFYCCCFQFFKLSVFKQVVGNLAITINNHFKFFQLENRNELPKKIVFPEFFSLVSVTSLSTDALGIWGTSWWIGYVKSLSPYVITPVSNSN